MSPHILVVGGVGYIGSHVAYHLHRHGYAITLLDSLRYGQSTERFRSWARVVVGDYGDRALLDALCAQQPFAAVVHCAALIEVAASCSDPASFYHNNVIKTQTLLDAMRDAAIPHIIFSSSCAVYGVPEQVPITESHPFAPISPYGRTKVAIEYLLHDYAAAYDINYVSLRYFNACGAHPEAGLGEYHVPETHLIPLVLRALQAGTPITVCGTDYDTVDGTAVRDYVHVRDIADAHARALHHLQTSGISECFNLGTGVGYSVKQVIDMAEKICGTVAQRVHAPRRPGDPPVLVAQAHRAASLLGWGATLDLTEVLRSALQWETMQQSQ